MNRVLARAAAGVLAIGVSVTTSPLLIAQDASTQAGTTSAASTQQSTQAAPATQQSAQPAPDSQQTPSNPNNLPPVEMPENPGQQPNQNNQQNLPPAPKQQTPTQPNGTAVAPPIELSGGAASKPAGVAIAPPKQRQIRSLLIKLGFLAGAGIAIGTVVGLSAASPGHVPNSPGH
ncbi:MAG TPA: hypothetical protein VF447_00630 [Terriglobales bacterium]